MGFFLILLYQMLVYLILFNGLVILEHIKKKTKETESFRKSD